jgi:ABC-2 type transport system permease protein
VNPLTGVAQLVLTLWSIITLPFYAALAAALLAALEYQRDNWSRLLALPVRRFSIYAAKWFVAAALLLVSSIVLAAAVCLASEMLRLIKPGWRSAPLPAAMVSPGQRNARSDCRS